jgi:predicted site-specific integrase-resolvase
MSGEGFVDSSALASHLGVEVGTVYTWQSMGRLPVHYLPGSSRPRYKISEVERSMSCRRRRRRKAG